MATEISTPRVRAPQRSFNAWNWARENLFSTWYNAIITVVLFVIIFQIISIFFGWALTTTGWVAALANVRLLAVGLYPAELTWRVEVGVWFVALLVGLSGGTWRGIMQGLTMALAAVLTLVLLLSLTFPPADIVDPLPTLVFLLGSLALIGAGFFVGRAVGDKMRWPLIIAWLLSYPLLIVLIRGFGGEGSPLPLVTTNLWGGLMLTIILAVTGIVLSFPIGILLALGRRSNLPVIKSFSIVYIELIRGVPLITVLFMSSLMLPLFLPAGVRIDSVVRAIVAITLFSAAYLAENVRGGLQSLPKGQAEASRALGMNAVQTTLLITLPQALRAVIPVLVGQFISLFKDTSLVAIVGLIDLLGVAQKVVNQPEWLSINGGVWRETFLIVAAVYWIFSFTMSRTSRQIESNLSAGKQ